MAIISLKPGSVVYYDGVKHKVVKAVSHLKVLLKDEENGGAMVVETRELSVTPPSEDPPSATLIEDLAINLREAALKRLAIIEPLLVPNRTRAMVEQRAAEVGRDIATIYRWIKSYETTRSLICLAPGYKERGGKGKGRLTDEVESIITDVINDEFLTEQRKTIQEVHETIEQMCKKAGLKPPAKNTLVKRLNKRSQKEIAGARGGRKAEQQFEALKGNFPGGNYPLETIQIDHTPLDVVVVDEVHRKPVGRPWLTLAIDVYSRMVFGFFISLDRPGFFSVGQTLLQGILPKESFLKEHGINAPWEIHGLPTVVHVDNAGEFNADDFLLFCKDNRIEINWRPVKKPQYGGHIERLGGTLNKRIHSLRGTTFSDTDEKGEYDSEGNACFTISELEHWFAYRVLGVYHNRRHSGIGMPPRKKYEIGVFGDDVTPGSGLPDIVEDTQRLRLSLLPSIKRTVQRDGVSIDAITYFHDCLRRWVNIKDEKGKKRLFLFRRDPRDISPIFFFDPELEDHFAIPYRDFRRPHMSIWELKRTKQYLREKGISEANEYQIFQAREKLREIELAAAEKTKAVRREQEAARHRARTHKSDKKSVPLPEQGSSKTPQKESTVADDIFANVEPFVGIEVVSKKED